MTKDSLHLRIVQRERNAIRDDKVTSRMCSVNGSNQTGDVLICWKSVLSVFARKE